jgi:peptide methionine sulfoxide reductase MsrA
MSENTETAILAGGCFWPAQELLRHRDGVLGGGGRGPERSPALS